MAPSSSVKQRRLLLAAVAVAALLLAAAGVASAGSRRPVHLRLYMHDVMRGPGTTAIHLIHGVGPPHDVERGGYFGDTAAIDDVVTEEPDAGSRAVGRARGTYMLASQHEEVLVVAVTVALTAGPYNGSTFSVAGSVGVYDDKAEAAVVGGTGRLRRAAGYLTWRMVKLVVPEGYVMVELDVHMSVPVSAAAAAGGNWSSVANE
ncbi:hypothetical protein ACP70R_046484 [Stipagrostis hirtigluma subsp. patula]